MKEVRPINLSDIISQSILNLLEQYDGTAEIQRNELASKIGCVPSQISYVITSRFTPEKGYLVESRRGGGGYIRISKITLNPRDLVVHLINAIGARLDEGSCRVILQNLINDKILAEETARMMWSALNTSALREVPQELRDNVRASIFKNMLLTVI